MLVLQQQRDGAEVCVRAGAELAFCGALRGGVVQQAERGGGGGGDEGVEDVGAVGEGGGDQIQDAQGEGVHGCRVGFGRVLEGGGLEERGGGVDVGAHEEAAGEDEGGGWGEGGADVETLWGVRWEGRWGGRGKGLL